MTETPFTVHKALDEAIVHHRAQRRAEAEAIYRRILAVDPQHADSLHLLGVLTYQKGQCDLAIEMISAAIAVNGEVAAFHFNLGNALQGQGRPEQAILSYDQALALKPDYLEALCNIANLLHDQGKLDEAIARYEQALIMKPDFPEVLCDLGRAHKDRGEFEHAIGRYRQAIALRPGYAEALSNLGNVLRDCAELKEAVACYEKAHAVAPNSSEVLSNLGAALQELGSLDEAISYYERALAISPGDNRARSNLLFARAAQVRPEASDYLALAQDWETHCAPQTGVSDRIRYRRPDTIGRRLRIGYVSGDFRSHPVSYFAEQIFANHDRHKVEIFAYSTSSRQDDVTARLRGLVDSWVLLTGLSDMGARERIEADEIDVLVDLSGHTAENRLGIFALRAAPVQVHYLGFFASTGLSQMDYWIGDEIVTPASADPQFREKLWRLPRVWVSYDAQREAPPPSWCPARDGRLWLGSFNKLVKLTTETFVLWGRVLRALPEANLLLKTKGLADPDNRLRIFDALAAQGIAADRIEFADHRTTPNWRSHMAYYDRLDVALDPVGGIGGGTTTCDALWMGVPVISQLGDCMATRMTASMLHAIGRPEWIAQDAQGYVDRVVSLARNVEGRKALRRAQRARMAASPLCDAAGLARALEGAFLSMFEQWAASGAGSTPTPTAQAIVQQGLKHHQEGRLEQAEELYRRALALDPDHANGWHLLGVLASQIGHHDVGEQMIAKAISLNPTAAAFHLNLGNALEAQGRLSEAISSYRAALVHQANFPEALYNLGNVLQNLGRLDDAIASYERVLAIRPDIPEALSNLGAALKSKGMMSEAVARQQQALALRPGFVNALNHMGNAFRDQGKADEAVACYESALAIAPSDLATHSNRLFVRATQASFDIDRYLALGREWEKLFRGQSGSVTPADAFRRRPRDGRRLRVGYVSGDLWKHAVSYFIGQVFAAHDRQRIELFAYSASARCDDVTGHLRGLVDHWRGIADLSDTAACDRILADEIDVLIDLSGHTARNRLGVFALRAAPIQAHYLSFASTGLSQMDYFIGDQLVTPPETDAQFSETVWRLPRVWVTYDGQDAPPPAWRPADDGTLWLGNFNNLVKLTPESMALWARLLLALPEAKLLLKTKGLADPGICRFILGSFVARGVAFDRIELVDDSATPEWRKHMAYYDRLDLALDPVGGLGGGTTSLDALWMGVPVLTLEGDRMATRMTGTLLRAMGRPEWIAANEEDYIGRAVALARDVASRKVWRSEQRAHMAASPLCDASGLARALEDAFIAMFERWRSDHKFTTRDIASHEVPHGQ